MLKAFHETPVGGHAGFEKTYQSLCANFYWKGMRAGVKEFVRKCMVCQTIKYYNVAPHRLLQPLEVPERVWEDLAMDFITGLPNSWGNTTILVVIDHLTKYSHFGALPTSYTTSKVVELL